MTKLKRVSFISLGCSKNLVDTEIMMALIKNNSFTLVDDPACCDILIINTCGFIGDAKKESIDTILECASLKKHGQLKKLIVTGCLVQRYRSELVKELPEVDLFLGTTEFHRVAEFCSSLVHSREERVAFDSESFAGSFLYNHTTPRLIATSKSSAYIKISEGCSNRCSYCVIPLIRGQLHSRPIDSILEEAKTLVRSKILEINLLAHDTASYGKDIAARTLLPDLLEKLAPIAKSSWIRILYTHPEGITDEIIEVIARHDAICPYLDIPIQHSHPDILFSMNRKASVDVLKPLIEKLRRKIPSVILRTTLMVGCPGEKDKHFQHLLDFIEWAQFDRLGVFEYSKEENTPMGSLKETVSKKVKRERKEAIMEVQAKISFKKNKKLVGTVQDVLIEEKESENSLVGRSRFHAPEVDGCVFVTTPQNSSSIDTGKIIPVKITQAETYDLIGISI